MNEETPEDPVLAQWFENHYICSECGTSWTDEWSCMCDDRCPKCNAEIVPTESVDLSRPLTEEDYIGAARLLTGSRDATREQATDEDAREYAEAMMEGGEYRFRPEVLSMRA